MQETAYMCDRFCRALHVSLRSATLPCLICPQRPVTWGNFGLPIRLCNFPVDQHSIGCCLDTLI